MKNIFTFLVCSERSGSNLLTKIFNNNSEFCGPSPTHLLRHFVPLLNKYTNDEDQLVKDISQVFNSKIGYWNTSVNVEELNELKKKEFSNLYKYIYAKEALYENKKRLFIKENHVYNIIPYILLAFPESKFLTMVRDPRDMALSWKNAKALRGGIIRAVDIWLTDQSMAINFYKNLRLFNRDIIIRYEDLLINPEIELTKCCNILDCSFEESMLEYFDNETTRKNATEATDWQNISKKLITNNFDKYKNELSEAEIKYIEYKCDKYMTYLNYNKEYKLISEDEFYRIESMLREVEPDNKPGYNKEVTKEERERRKNMSELLGEIKDYEETFAL